MCATLKESKTGIIGLGKMRMLHAAILNSIDNIRVTTVAYTEKLITSFVEKNIPTITNHERQLRPLIAIMMFKKINI